MVDPPGSNAQVYIKFHFWGSVGWNPSHTSMLDNF
jgi:hypothetical protein